MTLSGTEQEWKLAQSSMENASSGLSSASNELSVASVKAKSASGLSSSLYDLFFIFYLIMFSNIDIGSYLCLTITHKRKLIY